MTKGRFERQRDEGRDWNGKGMREEERGKMAEGVGPSDLCPQFLCPLSLVVAVASE
jgi:hypothetical protein